ncbi:unnamed protein product, partial [Laminaria digitata]
AVPPQPASPRTKYEEEEEEEEEEEKEAVIADVDALEPMPASQLRGAPAPVPAVTATTTPTAAAWTGKREGAPAASALGDDKDSSLTLMVGGANDGPAHHHHFGADNEAGAATALKPTRVESSASSSPASSPRLLVGARDPVERKGPSVLGARTNRGRLEAWWDDVARKPAAMSLATRVRTDAASRFDGPVPRRSRSVGHSGDNAGESTGGNPPGDRAERTVACKMAGCASGYVSGARGGGGGGGHPRARSSPPGQGLQQE